MEGVHWSISKSRSPMRSLPAVWHAVSASCCSWCRCRRSSSMCNCAGAVLQQPCEWAGQHCIVLHCNAAALPRPAVTDDPDGVSCGHCSLLHPHNAHTLLSGERSAVRRLPECTAQTAEKNVGEVEECNSTVQLIGKCTS